VQTCAHPISALAELRKLVENDHVHLVAGVILSSAYATFERMTPATRWTWSFSTSLRSLVRAVAGRPSLSSRITSSLRPAICQPLSCQYSSQPLYMSLPAAAMAPDRGERNPILIGPCA